MKSDLFTWVNSEAGKVIFPKAQIGEIASAV